MALLNVEPTGTVRTAPQLKELARAVSRQAHDLYRDLARRMSELGNEPAREAFERVDSLLSEGGPSEPAGKIAQAPAVFQEEDFGATRLVTPYAAYSLAVRNQERAFALWTYVSANSSDPEVQSAAEHLARDEIARVKSLRTVRRRAFHAKRPSPVSLEALRTASIDELKRQAGETESALAELHERVSGRLAEHGDPRSTTIASLASEERESARRLGAQPPAEQRPSPLPRDPDALAGLAIERLEAAVELYLAAAEASRREEVVSLAQDLANRGIGRLSLLR